MRYRVDEGGRHEFLGDESLNPDFAKQLAANSTFRTCKNPTHQHWWTLGYRAGLQGLPKQVPPARRDEGGQMLLVPSGDRFEIAQQPHERSVGGVRARYWLLGWDEGHAIFSREPEGRP